MEETNVSPLDLLSLPELAQELMQQEKISDLTATAFIMETLEARRDVRLFLTLPNRAPRRLPQLTTQTGERTVLARDSCLRELRGQYWKDCGGYVRMTGSVEALSILHADALAVFGLGKSNAVMVAEKLPERLDAFPAQEAAILHALKSLGFDAQALPRPVNGHKSRVLKELRDKLFREKAMHSESAFRKALARLRKDDRIQDGPIAESATLRRSGAGSKVARGRVT